MTNWVDAARATIARVHNGLADDISLADRIKAVDAAYPFGERAYWPHKGWLKARKAYLVRYGYKPRNAPPLTLLDKLPRDPVTGRPVIL